MEMRNGYQRYQVYRVINDISNSGVVISSTLRGEEKWYNASCPSSWPNFIVSVFRPSPYTLLYIPLFSGHEARLDPSIPGLYEAA